MRVFVSGGTGFLGKPLVKELARQHTVHLLARRESDFAELQKLRNVKIFWGDVRNYDSIAETIKGCSVVFHLAALVSSWAPREQYFEVNVEGFEKVAVAALEQKVKKFVYVSSFLALGNSDSCPNRICDETKKHSGEFHNEYEHTKYLALLKVKNLLEADVPIVTVIPGILYGKGALREGNYFGRWIDAYQRNKTIIIPGDGKQLGCCALIEDVVKGMILAWKKGEVGEKYILGGPNVQLKEFVTGIEKAGKRKGRVKHAPFLLLKTFAALAEAKAKLLGGKPLLTRHEVEVFKHDWAYSSEKAERELGYSITPLEKGMKKTICP